jgi:hypothetical protein
MKIEQWDVVVLALPYGRSVDPRPCIVVEPPGWDGSLCVIPLSSHLGLSQEWRDFLFDPEHPDFKATGLRRASYANGSEIHRSHGAVLKKLGRLEGKLLDDFRDWAGE